MKTLTSIVYIAIIVTYFLHMFVNKTKATTQDLFLVGIMSLIFIIGNYIYSALKQEL